MYVVTGLVLFLLGYADHVTSQLITRHVSNHGRLDHVLLDNLGHVFVGGTDVILQFNDESLNPADLISTVYTNCGLPTTVPTTCDVSNNVSVFLLYRHNRIEETNAQLMMCGSLNLGECFVYDVRNISKFFIIVSPDEDVPMQSRLGSVTSAAVAQSYGDFLFSAISEVGMETRSEIYTFSERWFHRVENDSFQYFMYYKERSLQDIYITSKPGTVFAFLTGFIYNESAYFLRNSHTIHSTEAFLSQSCIYDHYFRSYIETRLRCGLYVIAETAIIFNVTEKTYLLVTFTSRLHPGTALCVYDVEELEAQFRSIHRDCFYQKLGHWPSWVKQDGEACDTVHNLTKIECGWTQHNRRILAQEAIKHDPVYLNPSHGVVMTSLAFLDAGDKAVGCIGHSDGSLKKMLFDVGMSKFHLLYEVNIADNQTIDPNMAINLDGNKLFYTYSNTVAMLRLDDCSLLPTCQSCLADMASCVWIGSCVSPNNVTTGVRVYTYFCPPNILDVKPLTGPPEGGTVITLHGDLGLPGDHVTLRVGKAIFNTILPPSTNDELNITNDAAQPGSVEADIVLRVDSTNLDFENPWDIIINDSTVYHVPFKYLTPTLASGPDVITYVIRSGNVGIQLRGENLDIGSSRKLLVGDAECLHIRTSSKNLSCMAPAQEDIGNYSSLMYIDRARVPGPPIIYIPDPIITDVTPKRIIVSGGVPVTIRGKNLYGLGLGVHLTLGQDRHQTTNPTEPCQVFGEDLVCTAAAQTISRDPPFMVPLGLANEFGSFDNAMVFFDHKHRYVTLVEDPEIIEGNPTMYLGISNMTNIPIRGKRLNHVTKSDIRVSVGRNQCKITAKTDTSLNCNVEFKKQEDVGLHQKILVRIGTNLVFHPGNLIRGIARPVAFSAAEAPRSTEITFIGLGIVGALLVVIAVVALLTLRMRRKLRRQRTPFNVIFHREVEMSEGSETATADLAESQTRQNDYQPMARRPEVNGAEGKEDMQPLLPDIDADLKLSLDQQGLLVNPDMLVLGEAIGQGHFGCVYKGYLHKPGEKGETIVAAKTLHRGGPTEINVSRFLKEALIMKDFHHRNVIELVGICVGMEDLPLVVLPYMTRGDVLTYIRDVNNVPTVKRLVEFGIDIANGMYYLSQLKFVHRDLAARNCMIDDQLTVKVADFGLSRDVYEKEYYSSCDKKTMLPVKWMSPESLELGLFSYKTDMWSYGVVLWELLTRGMNPYPGVDNWDVLRFLRTGRRLSKPDYCPEGMYRIMQHCWTWEPEDRPSFGDLTTVIPQLLRRLERFSRSSSSEETK